jgi:hypothetical protein
MPIKIQITESASVFCGSVCASATRYRGLENIGVRAVIVAELKFSKEANKKIDGAPT